MKKLLISINHGKKKIRNLIDFTSYFQLIIENFFFEEKIFLLKEIKKLFKIFQINKFKFEPSYY